MTFLRTSVPPIRLLKTSGLMARGSSLTDKLARSCRLRSAFRHVGYVFQRPPGTTAARSARDIVEAFECEARLVLPFLVAILSVALPAFAQSPLSLTEAIARAKARNQIGRASCRERV